MQSEGMRATASIPSSADAYVDAAFLAAASLQRSDLPPASLRELLHLLRRSPRSVQLALIERVQTHYLSQRAVGLAGRVVTLPPLALAGRTAGRALRLARRGRDRATALRDRILDATLGRVQRSLPYRCAVAYAAMILADARVAIQLHADAARAAPAVHSSSFISSTPASCSLSPLSPGASKLAAVGWRTRRFVYAMARFTGQSRRLLFARSLRHWPIDALTLWFQLLLLFLPAEDVAYEQVRESLVDCLRWYETDGSSQQRNKQQQLLSNSISTMQYNKLRNTNGSDGTRLLTSGGAGDAARYIYHNHSASGNARVQVEGQQSSTDSFLAELCSPADCASPVRLRTRRPSPIDSSSSGSSASSFAVAAADGALSPSPSPTLPAASHNYYSRHYRADSIDSPSSEIDFASDVGTPAFSPIRSAYALPPLPPPQPLAPVVQQYATAAEAVAAMAAAKAAAAAAAAGASGAGSTLHPSSPRHHHLRTASAAILPSLGASLHSTASHSTSLSMSFDCSNARVLYSRALDLIARAGIDLADVSMDDSVNEDTAAADGLTTPQQEADEYPRRASESEQAWDLQSVGSAREILLQLGDATDSESESFPHSGRSERSARQQRQQQHLRTASAHEQMSVGELDGAELQPGGAGFTSPLTAAEGRQNRSARKELFPADSGAPTYAAIAEGTEQAASATALTSASLAAAAAAADAAVASVDARPRLILPLWLHSSSRHLAASQTLLLNLHPLLSHLCTSHAVELQLLNEELKGWNAELPLGEPSRP